MPPHSDTSRPQPAWVEHAIWWHVFPLGFAGAPASTSDGAGAADGFRRLADWLDYAVELGVSGILLGPIFASETHGYDTVDHDRIDPRLGDEADFTAFVAAAKQRGLRIVLDGVFNHIGRGSELVRRAVQGEPGGPDSRWFRDAGTDAEGAPRFENFEGHDALVAFDHGEPDVAALVTRVMNRWLDAGIDGWRLDVAYAVPPRFWSAVLGEVRRAHPDAWFFGEVIHGDYSAIVEESTMDSVTQYELWQAVHHSITDGNFFELAHALERHDEFVRQFAPFTFVGNHDVTRIASALVDEAPTPRHLAHALAVLFTVGGTPAVYYGDEQGMRGVKEERFGGDDEIRPAFPARPDDLAPEGWSVYRLHEELIGVRRRHPWLHRASYRTISLTNTELVYESRAGDERVVVALSIGDDPLLLDGEVQDLEVVAGSVSDGAVPPHGWAILAP